MDMAKLSAYGIDGTVQDLEHTINPRESRRPRRDDVLKLFLKLMRAFPNDEIPCSSELEPRLDLCEKVVFEAGRSENSSGAYYSITKYHAHQDDRGIFVALRVSNDSGVSCISIHSVGITILRFILFRQRGIGLRFSKGFFTNN